MLINFKVKNVLSFKDLNELSFSAGTTKRYSDRIKQEKKFSILKFCAIYGANASGKSNLVSALMIMRNLVLHGLPKIFNNFYFKLDSKCKLEPSYFEVELKLGDKYYAYGFTISFYENKLVSEWLYELKLDKEIPIFERNLEDKTFNLYLELDGQLKDKFDVYVDDLKEDNKTLFLSTMINKIKLLTNTKAEIFLTILQWFILKLDITMPNSILTSGDYFMFNDKLDELSDLLKAFDTGIEKVTTKEISQDEAEKNIASDILIEIKSNLAEEAISNNKKKLAMLRGNGKYWIIEFVENKYKYKKVCFFHESNPDKEFDVSEESDGTIRIIDLAEILLTKAKNKVFVIDELDRCLHPQVTMEFVELFLEKAKKSDNQLIVTTHESRMLDFDLLRRDEIWFVNKIKGISQLYSLEEYNERFDKKIDKAYLDGRYGGVPIFNNIFPISGINEN